jgi:hypothetical protein
MPVDIGQHFGQYDIKYPFNSGGAKVRSDECLYHPPAGCHASNRGFQLVLCKEHRVGMVYVSLQLLSTLSTY